MKKSILMAAFFGAAMLSGADFRLDVEGGKNLAFAPGKAASGVSLGQAGWLGDKKDQRLVAIVKVTPEWKEYSFSFTPKKDGRATVQLMSNQVGAFADCDRIQVTGAKLSNGSFEKLRADGTPERWWKMNQAQIVTDGKAGEGKNFVRTSHNDRWVGDLDCKAGQVVTLTFLARSEK